MISTIKITQDNDGRRLDRTLRSMFKWIALDEIMMSIRKGEVRVNTKRVRKHAFRVSAGDELSVPWTLTDDGTHINTYNTWGNISVIFQGENVLILNKPAGILVQPNEYYGDSVISRVWGVLGTKTPAPAHRLDRNTTGVLTVALHGDALRSLEEVFRERTIRKFYRAIVTGKAPDTMIDAPLLKDPDSNTVTVSPDGLTARTKCTCLASNEKFSLVELELLTGRTHQARVHMAHIGHPILGDRKYGDFDANREKGDMVKRPLLHAYMLQFPEALPSCLDEVAGKKFSAPLPDDMQNFINAEELS